MDSNSQAPLMNTQGQGQGQVQNYPANYPSQGYYTQYPAQPNAAYPPPSYQYSQPYPQAPPPTQSMPPPVYQPQQTTYVVAVQPNQAWGLFPQACVCQFCGREVMSAVRSQPGIAAWVSCGILCIVGLWPCCLYPFCIDSCNDKYHVCPECNRIMGKYNTI